ncbi:MAG: response regulator [Treponema sp.]|jgi:response regulator NasT|nr:response regulator [Treponema sp.]
MKLRSLKNVLVISENKTFFDSMKLILPPDEFAVEHTCSGGEARRLIVNRQFDILVINAPLPDEHGLSFATDYVDSSMGILLVCPPETYDALSADGEENGIIVLSSSNPPAFVYVAIKMISSMVKRLERLEKKNRTLQEKMEDIRIVNKAKWALIDKNKMNEAEAHKYIEKMAMDKRISRREVAEMILDMLD